MTRWGAIFVCLAAGVAQAKDVRFEFNDTLQVQDTEISYGADLTLRAVGPTRVEVEALLDLQDLQRRIEADMSGVQLIDVCGNRTDVTSISLDAEDQTVGLSGALTSQVFECERTGATGWQRGEAIRLLSLRFSAQATAQVDEDCITFELLDLTLVPAGRADVPKEDPDLQAARVLLLEAVNVLLRRRPLCPELPPELAVLDAQLETGGPQEIGDGGLGIYTRGSVDVSPTTIIGILGVLQNEGAIPGPP
ncbi:MAG: hypothetical protein AAGK37_02315 [Pseudomonadota bacterium]